MTKRKTLEYLVKRINELEKRPLTAYTQTKTGIKGNKGHLHLEKRFGGGNPYIYQVNEMCENTGVSSFSGSNYMKADEMLAFLNGYLKAKEVKF